MSIDSLSAELNLWYERNCVQGNLSWNYLAKKTGITVSNITKIARGDVALPKYQTAKALLKTICPEDDVEVNTYLRTAYPAKSFNFVDVEAETPRSVVFLGRKSIEILEDDLSFRLYKLALGNSSSIKSLKASFGEVQVSTRLESLERAQLVRIDADVLMRNDDLKFTQSNDPVLIAKHFKYNIDMVSAKKVLAKKGIGEIDAHVNRLLFYHGPFTEEALAMMVNETLDFISALAKKYSSEKYRGDVPGFIDITTGRFDTK